MLNLRTGFILRDVIDLQTKLGSFPIEKIHLNAESRDAAGFERMVGLSILVANLYRIGLTPPTACEPRNTGPRSDGDGGSVAWTRRIPARAAANHRKWPEIPEIPPKITRTSQSGIDYSRSTTKNPGFSTKHN